MRVSIYFNVIPIEFSFDDGDTINSMIQARQKRYNIQSENCMSPKMSAHSQYNRLP